MRLKRMGRKNCSLPWAEGGRDGWEVYRLLHLLLFPLTPSTKAVQHWFSTQPWASNFSWDKPQGVSLVLVSIGNVELKYWDIFLNNEWWSFCSSSFKPKEEEVLALLATIFRPWKDGYTWYYVRCEMQALKCFAIGTAWTTPATKIKSLKTSSISNSI